MPAATDYVLILRPVPRATPAAVRLRRALKYLGRICELRCVHVDDLAPGNVARVIAGLKRLNNEHPHQQ